MRTIGAAIVCATCIAGAIIGDTGLMTVNEARNWDWTAAIAIMLFIIFAQTDRSK